LRYDPRGAGLSEKATVLTLDTVLDNLVALLDALGFTDPVHIASWRTKPGAVPRTDTAILVRLACPYK